MSFDVHGQTTAFTFLLPETQTATSVASAAVDVSQYIGNLKVIQAVGAEGGSDPTLAGKVQDSADGSTDWQDVTGAAFTALDGAGTAVESLAVETRLTRKYLRYVATLGGTNPTFAMSVLGVGTKQNQ